MKRIFNALRRTLAIVGVCMIPASFMFSGTVLGSALDSALKLKVRPSFSGGEVRARVFDPASDDNGAGRLLYPPRALAHAGAMDLVRYTVYEPMTETTWGEDRDYWQLAVTLKEMPNPLGAPAGFSFPSVRIYIDTDGTRSGSTETAFARAEMVAFDPAHPWDVYVEFDGWHDSALLKTADGKTDMRIKMISVPEMRTLFVRLPLHLPEVKRMLDGRTTWHYVLVAAYDPMAQGGVMRPPRASARQSASEMEPRLYDFLAPKGMEQAALLSSWNEEAYACAKLVPVEIRKGVRTAMPDMARLEREAKVEAEQREARERSLAEETLRTGAGFERARAFLALGRRQEAEAAFQVLRGDPALACRATAYLGMIVAMKAGETGNLGEAMRMVNKAYAMWDEAEALMRTDADRAALFANRGNVSLSVPEGVFKKSASGGRDFLAACELFVKLGDPVNAQIALVKAALCFDRAGKADQAEIALVRAASIKPVSAQVRLECARRGIGL